MTGVQTCALPIWEFKFSGREVIYADPPYMPETRLRHHIYRHEYGATDHEQLLEILLSLPCRVILSGYRHPVYDDALRHWSVVTYTAQTQSGPREECVWTNFDQPEQLHDCRYVGDTYRDRERTRRKLSSMQRKVEGLHHHERQLFLEWVQNNYLCDAQPNGSLA